MARKLKLGIIGCGDVGNTVEESSRKAKNIVITAVMDTDLKAAENLARKKNIPYTTELKECQDFQSFLKFIKALLHSLATQPRYSSSQRVKVEEAIKI